MRNELPSFDVQEISEATSQLNFEDNDSDSTEIDNSWTHLDEIDSGNEGSLVENKQTHDDITIEPVSKLALAGK